MRILIAGSGGQLGRELCRLLANPAQHEVVALDRAALDLTCAAAVEAAVRAAAPEAIINCAAYNRVDAAEHEPGAAYAVNAFVPLHLARAAQAVGACLVQVSTNYVFDGCAAAPYRESDCPRPLSVYGASKLAGEQLASLACERHFIVRTAGLYGWGGSRAKAGGGNFVEAILARAAAGQPLRVVNDQRLSPTAVADLAPALVALLAQNGDYGCYHLTSQGDCNWHEFARAILEISHLNAELKPISSAELAAAARRPVNGVLAHDRARAAGLPSLPHWRDALEGYMRARRGIPQS